MAALAISDYVGAADVDGGVIGDMIAITQEDN
jgi:hypothetical protein